MKNILSSKILSLAIVALVLSHVIVMAAGGGAKAKSKSKSQVAIPRSKSAKKSGFVGIGFLSKAFRETKTFFCSELEATTLQLTRPTDAKLPAQAMEMLVDCVNAEYEDAKFMVTFLAKFSRKLSEVNVFTKLKSLLCVHKLMQCCGEGAKGAISKCVSSLRREPDPKCGGREFFSLEYLDEASGLASNVGELQAAEFAREYGSFLLDVIELRGDKATIKEGGVELSEGCLGLIEQFELVDKALKAAKESGGSGGLIRECFDTAKQDRQWALKQLLKCHENGLSDSSIAKDVAAALSANGLLEEEEEKVEIVSAKSEKPEKSVEKSEKSELAERTTASSNEGIGPASTICVDVSEKAQPISQVTEEATVEPLPKKAAAEEIESVDQTVPETKVKPVVSPVEPKVVSSTSPKASAPKAPPKKSTAASGKTPTASSSTSPEKKKKKQTSPQKKTSQALNKSTNQ